MPSTTLNELFHGPGIRARLVCRHDECLVDIGVEQGHAASTEATVEVTLQPRGRDGLPRGGPLEICRAVIRLAGVVGDRWFWGRIHLPTSITPARVRECHIRVRPHPK